MGARVVYTKAFKPEGITYNEAGTQTQDNIFRNDDEGGSSTSALGRDSWQVIINKGSIVATGSDQSQVVNGFLCEWD